jgi:hypothetical protein
MIHLIVDKYYIKVSPHIYEEIHAELNEKDEVVLEPTGTRLEVNLCEKVAPVSLDNIKATLLEKRENEKSKQMENEKRKSRLYNRMK